MEGGRLSSLPSEHLSCGARSSYHGFGYQLSLLVLYLKKCVKEKRSFRLATEMGGLGSLDDVVLLMEPQGGGPVSYLFLQAKHSRKTSELITHSALMSDGEFGLKKYFASYLVIAQNTMLNRHNPYFAQAKKTYVLFGNKGLDVMSLLRCGGSIEASNSADVPHLPKMGESEPLNCRVKLSPEDVGRCTKHIMVLLAKGLFRCFMGNEPNEGEIREMFDLFSPTLISEKVIVGEKLHPNFIEGINLSKDAMEFRDIFLKEMRKGMTKKHDPVKDFWTEVKAMKLKRLLVCAQGKHPPNWPSVSDVEDFLQNLVLCVGQPGEEELGKYIHEDRDNVFNVLNPHVMSISLYTAIADWFKANRGTFLSDKDFYNFVNLGKDSLKSYECVGLSKAYLNQLESYGLEFGDKAAAEIMKLLKFDESVICLLQTDNILMSCLKMYGAIEKLRQIIKQEDALLFIKLSTFFSNDINFTKAFQSPKNFNLLIIEADLPDVGKFIEIILNIFSKFSENVRKKCLIIMDSKDKGGIKKELGNLKIIQDKFCFSDLNKISKDKILSKNITFQGESIEFGKLADMDDLVKPDIIFRLMKNEKIVIGKELNKVEDHYIERKFHHQFEVNGMKFTEIADKTKPGLFKGLIPVKKSGKNVEANALFEKDKNMRAVEERMEMFGFFLKDDRKTEENLKNLKNLYGKDEEHTEVWFREEISKIAAVQLGQDSSHIPKDYTVKDLFQTKNDRKLIVVCDTAGSGKSTAMSALCKEIKKVNNIEWVLKINMTSFVSTLNGAGELNRKKAVNLLVEESLTNDLEKRLFKRSMIRKGCGVTLVIDGIDEVGSQTRHSAVEFILHLRDVGLGRIFVTVRPYFRPFLEKHFGPLYFSLVPLSHGDQVDVLKKYWGNVDSSVVERVINSFAHNSFDKDFTSLPLQLLMVAEVFKGSDKLPQKIDNLYNLFKRFVEKKIKIYTEEKCSGSLVNFPAVDFFIETLMKGHKQLGLESLFHRSIEDKKLHKGIEEELPKLGLVQSSGSKKTFVHRTFAEYFACEYFVDEIVGKGINSKLAASILLESDFRGVRAFLNDRLKEKKIKQWKLVEGWEIKGSKGETLLHVAIDEGLEEVAKFVLRSLPNPASILSTRLPETQFTPLLAAVGKCSSELIKEMLEAGANVNAQDSMGLRPVHHAARQRDLSSLRVLIARGAEIAIKSNSGFSLLHCAVGGGNLKLIKYVIEGLGCEINDTIGLGMSNLCLAVYLGHLEVAKYLISKGSSILLVQTGGTTLLHIAVRGGNLQMVRYLVEELKLDIKVKLNDGQTIQHYAAFFGRIEIVKYFIKMGINIQGLTVLKRSVLHLAVEGGQKEMVQYLVEEEKMNIELPDSVGVRPAHVAAFNGYLEILHYLRAKGANFGAVIEEGRTLLHAAIQGKHVEIALYLIREGCLKLDAKSDQGFSAASIAAGKGLIPVLKALKTAGADMNTKDKTGRSLLHFAAQEGHLETVRYLVEEIKMDVNYKNKDGLTIAHICSFMGNLDILKYLLQNGANPNIKTNHGKSIIDCAIQNSQHSVVAYLRNEVKIKK